MAVAKNKSASFVLLENPFIGQNIPDTKPLIRKKIPFIRFLGFTLYELLVVVAVGAILGVLAAPSMIDFVNNNRLTTQANSFLGALNLARSEAVRISTNAGVCASSNGSSCGGSWNQGYIVFQDTDNSGSWTAGDVIMRIEESFGNNTTLTNTTDGETLIMYNRVGLLTSGNTGDGTYELCHTTSGKGRQIDVLTTTGRASISANQLTGC